MTSGDQLGIRKWRVAIASHVRGVVGAARVAWGAITTTAAKNPNIAVFIILVNRKLVESVGPETSLSHSRTCLLSTQF